MVVDVHCWNSYHCMGLSGSQKEEEMGRTNEELVNAIISAMNREKPEGMKITEIIFKMVSTASLALVMWVLTTVNAMQRDMVQVTSDIQYMRSNVEKLEDFTSKPRFTQEHFDLQMSPVLKSINLVIEDAATLKKRQEDISSRLRQIEIDVNNLKKK